MSETPALSIYEKAFLQTDKTDAILVVERKKLHVNKALLSIHSDYFNTLFNSDFKEKSMPEIEIKDVKLEDFATLLSFVHGNALKPSGSQVEKLLELSDRFLLPSVKPYLEQLLINSDNGRFEKLRIAEKYDLEELLYNGIQQFTKEDSIWRLLETPSYKKLTHSTKVLILTNVLMQIQ
ncbi:hypothetical protein B9Z55_026988 [Caenorhabditis nigoni]|uniref:BTB domain-containing protein n=1 Tax=Caenorhabditis nigoni TaxID=1611254 RepID=A0A2G5SIE1_9PELO|nr:hypothetical protein B9Z55_026988 [Caenorhabditis nigoni]